MQKKKNATTSTGRAEYEESTLGEGGGGGTESRCKFQGRNNNKS